jgi:hypothetical protein
MRHAKLGTVLLLTFAFSLATTGASRAEDCKGIDSDYLSDGSKDQTIDAILDWADCIQREQQSRVGKYFCFVENSAGIQYNDDGSPFVGRIKPSNEKFFVEIREYGLGRDYRRKVCEESAFGVLRGSKSVKGEKLQGDFSERYGNSCLANYAWKFSVDGFFCALSKDTYRCSATFTSNLGVFSMSSKNEFDWFKETRQSEHGLNLYVSQGKCEKIN